MKGRSSNITVVVASMAMGIFVLSGALLRGQFLATDVFIGAVLLLGGIVALVFEIRKMREDNRTEKFGEFCYARVTSIVKEYAGRERHTSFARVYVKLYLFSNQKVIEASEILNLKEFPNLSIGDYIAVKYFQNDINAEFKVVKASVIADNIRIALGEEIIEHEEEKKEEKNKYLDDYEEDQSIIIEEGYGFEAGIDKVFNEKDFIIKENAELATTIKKRQANTTKIALLVIILPSIVLLADLIYIMMYILGIN